MHSNRSAGFSLIELAVVLVVVGLVLAIGAPPMIKYLNAQKVRDSAQILREELRMARQKAVTNGTRNWIYTQFGTGGTQYRTGVQTPVGATFPNGTVFNAPVDLPSRTKQIGANFGSGVTYVYFEPNGIPSWSGSVKVISTNPAVLDTVTVNLDLSGSVW